MFPYTVVNSIVNHPQWGDVEHDRHDPQAWSIFRSLEAVHRRWDVATMAMTRPGSPSKGRSCHRWGVPRWSWWSASDELGGAKMSQKWSFYHGKRMTIQWFHQQKVGIGPWKLWIATILCCVIGIYNDNILYISLSHHEKQEEITVVHG